MEIESEKRYENKDPVQFPFFFVFFWPFSSDVTLVSFPLPFVGWSEGFRALLRAARLRCLSRQRHKIEIMTMIRKRKEMYVLNFQSDFLRILVF
jgi:hypothetical protein